MEKQTYLVKLELPLQRTVTKAMVPSKPEMC